MGLAGRFAEYDVLESQNEGAKRDEQAGDNQLIDGGQAANAAPATAPGPSAYRIFRIGSGPPPPL